MHICTNLTHMYNCNLSLIQESAAFLDAATTIKPVAGIILGSGLGGVVSRMEIKDTIPYRDIPHFPQSTVAGHGGNLLFGYWNGVPVCVMQGRFHYYEGYSAQEVSFPVRVMKLLGIETLLVSNAAGGLNPAQHIGELMIISDHINMQPEHPLRGRNEESLGPRFPDMSAVYDPELIALCKRKASEMQIPVSEGVYVSVQGPTFETPAEYRMFRLLGGDAVGMSTVPEIIVARHMQIRCFAMSVITDLGVEGKIVEISHNDVVKAAREAGEKMTDLFGKMLPEIVK